MELHVSLDGDGDLTARIYRSLRDGVREGRLRPGDRLPPTRELARALGVSRGTVATAYERLTAEGFLDARVGAGTFVSDSAATGTRASSPPISRGLRPRPGWDHAPQPVTPLSSTRYDFRVGVPDIRLFPYDTWRRLLAAEWRPRRDPGYAEPAGHPGLRAAVARYVGYARSVRAEADDVVMTNGAQQAFNLVARVLVAPGDVVAVEEPGYPPARDVFEAHGARVVRVPVDGDGLVVSRLPRAARLVYVTPSHQFPLGVAMSLPRRRELLAWADAHDAAVLEDDYDSEYRFADRPLEPLHALDDGARVVYVGTFSKTLLPGLRLGYVVVPPSLRDAIRAARQLADGHGPVATQAALARFMDEGQLARHIRRTAKVYARRRSALLDGLGGALAPYLEAVPSAAGLHVCALLRSGDRRVAEAAADRARAAGVAVGTLSEYGTEPTGFALGYGAVEAADVPGGLELLAEALRAVIRR
ncbi:PLP-dependent aminotransferase family protein [Jiangella mangrovi]|uniref:GntR family transcriptional regulator/MocR family aminotransferase n=1 Tax=Jiangella mangrovi TaxID=1524084 RepID=A0A7W9GXX7_9ACTN|nr:PLP-dependent aminotransferase family protein [Jiangella mangrovi]MBB5791798.1 GntR family transcriptional regulator/MocR family aminotransferase [Jiangella mangrovi]